MPRSDAKTKEGQNPPATPRGAPRWLPLLLVVVCFLLAGVLRLYHFRSLPDFNPVDDTAIFTTEDALQYRYARMVAEARPIPSVDPGLHHPEGFNVRDNLTTLVEGVEGRLYRLAGGGQPLHVFLITVVCFVTSLGVFAAYGAATALWRSRRSGVFAAALYAVAVPTYARIIGGYGTEHFALPLLFFGVWLLLAALETPEERRAGLIALASGGCFALALSAWHLSRFLFSLVLLVLGAVWVYQQATGRAEAQRTARLIPWLLAPVLLASAGVPILRARPFWSSPVFLTALAIPAGSWLGRSRGGRFQLSAVLGLALVLVAGSRLLPSGETGYSHVWGIVAAKVANLGVKPADPARLPFEERVLWIEEVNSPGAASFLLTYGVLPLLALLGGIAGFARGGVSLRAPRSLLFAGLLVCAVGAYLLFARMTGFCVFFVIILAAGAARAPRPVLLVAVLLLLVETQRSVFYAEPSAWKNAVMARLPLPQVPVPVGKDDVTQLFSWVRRSTQEGDSFLTRMGTGPTLIAFTDRPVVIQSKMENREIWPRLQGFYQTLYGPEEPFYEYCRRYQVRYFLYEAGLTLDNTADSDRFIGNALRLPRSSVAYRCQFLPETLRHFRLAYQNAFYRVFEVAPSAGQPGASAMAYQPGYDLARYGSQTGEYFEDGGTAAVMAAIAGAKQHAGLARSLLAARRPGEALQEARRGLELDPGLEGLRVTVALALTLTGSPQEAVPVLREEIRFFPSTVLPRYYLGLLLVKAGKEREGLQVWEEGLRLEPTNAAILGARQRLRAGGLAGD